MWMLTSESQFDVIKAKLPHPISAIAYGVNDYIQFESFYFI